MPKGRRGLAGGLTIIELLVTIGILAIAAVVLASAIGSSQQITSLAREKEVATNAVNAYLAWVRQYYPDTKNSTNLTGFLTDQRTPVDFIPKTAPEKDVLKNVRAIVLKSTQEVVDVATPTAAWNYAAYSTGVNLANEYKAIYHARANYTGSPFNPVGGTGGPGLLTAAMTMHADDQKALYPVKTTAPLTFFRDLDADAAQNGTQPIAADKVLYIPVMIEMSWTPSAVGTRFERPAVSGFITENRQRIMVYAAVTPQH